MAEFFHTFWQSTLGVLNYYYESILFRVPWQENFFYGILLISLLVWGLEILMPWRKNQAVFRHEFFTDLAHLFFNFFVFSVMISGVYEVLSTTFTSLNIRMDSFQLIDLSQRHPWIQGLIFFLTLDFVQWVTHILLHKVPVLWKFHKVHHSVKEMGFAAHFRFHWMENLLYKPLKTLGIMLLGGFEPEQAYIIHFVAITIGHLNHANLNFSYGPLKYLINNPVMHLYHHARELPKGFEYGANFGISLSLWDYLFGFSYVPQANPDLTLGYEGDEEMPKGFINQQLFGLRKGK